MAVEWIKIRKAYRIYIVIWGVVVLYGVYRLAAELRHQFDENQTQYIVWTNGQVSSGPVNPLSIFSHLGDLSWHLGL